MSLTQKRIGLLLLASLFVVLAFALPPAAAGEGNSHRVAGLYQSELLDDEVSIPTLSAFTYTEDFQELVGASVHVEAVRESPFHIQVTTELSSDAGLLTAHKRAIHLLSAEVKEQATRQVTADLEYLEEVKRKAAKLGQNRREDETRIAATKPETSLETLSTKESQRLVFLKEEIKNLEAYLNGAPLPKTVRARLDRESLNSAEKRVTNQQAELRRLAKLFHPSSKALQAQRGSVEAAQSDLADIERQLAEIYLRALRLEMETLDDKASTRIQSSLATEDTRNASPTEPIPSTGSAWLDDRQKELEARGEVIGTAASLKLEGKLTFSIVQSSTQLWTIGCWVSALFFFLLAVFSTPESRRVESDTETGRCKDQKKTSLPARIEFSPAGLSGSPDHLERFFQSICLEITNTLTQPARRILILGDSDTETRLAFSIRLANSIGRQADRVRLIDFDFQEKSLSERLGRRDLPGVSELILHGGPVDEFFSSISGTRIQFAPAGKFSQFSSKIQTERLSQILGNSRNEVTVIDSSSNSQIELLITQVDAVLWTAGNDDGPRKPDRAILTLLRSAGLPIWGVSVAELRLFPIA